MKSMNDSSIQSKEEPSQSNELTKRLLRRATEPVGVIDTFQPRRQYQRAYDWLARRFSMLDRWRSRYGTADEAEESASLVFAKSQQPRAMLSHEGADFAFADARRNQTSISDSIDIVSRLARPTIAPREASVSSPAQFRVRRSRADASASPEVRSDDEDSKTDAENNISSAIRNRASENLISRSLASPDAGFPGQPQAADHIALRSPEIKTVEVENSAPPDSTSSLATSTQSSEQTIKSERASPPSAPRAVEIPSQKRSPLDAPLQLRHVEKGMARSRELPSPTAYAAAPRMIQRAPQTSNEQTPSFNESETARERVSFSDDSPSTRSAASVESKSVESQIADLPLSVPLVQRQIIATSPDAESSDVSRLPVQTEMRAASPEEKPAMIWRQSDHRSLPDGGQAITTQADSSASMVSLSRQSASPPAFEASTIPASSSGGIDIAQLAEQVWRLISRRLEIERERRGR
ncbi:MAG: hypothetical protein AB1631_24700 [Acidobacteriota bacterium]